LELAEEEATEELNCRSDQGNYRRGAENGEDHQDEDDHAIAIHDRLVLIGEVTGEDSSQYLLAVEGIDRNEVKDGQGDVQKNDDVKERYKKVRNGSETEENREGDGKEKIADRSGDGNNAGVAPGVGQIVGVEDDRFAPAKVDQKKHQGADGVEMGEGVQ